MRHVLKSLGFALLAAAGIARAGESSYVCEVAQIYNLQSDGTLRTSPIMEKVVKEHSFSVSRITGALSGNSLSLDTSSAKQIRVVNPGSKDNSFRAMADFGTFPNGSRPYQLIEVQEFVAGPVKPFVLMGDLGVVTGTCK